jgi:PadR family transcriptional regulator, regulatory protein AphA
LAERLPETTYAVLGLVDKASGSSGYELIGVAERSFAHFWPVSQTLLYRELHRLTDLRWVKATRVEQTRSPNKWIYQTTPTGRDVLTEWLDSPAELVSSFRSGFLLRFFFAHRMGPRRLQELLAEYRTAVSTQQDELKVLIEKLAQIQTEEARTGRQTALFGLRTAEAQLRWITDVEAELFPEPTP